MKRSTLGRCGLTSRARSLWAFLERASESMRTTALVSLLAVLSVSTVTAAPEVSKAAQPKPAAAYVAEQTTASNAPAAMDPASELEQLREELQALKAENAELRKQLAKLNGGAMPVAKAPAARPKAPPRKNYSGIEVGMTRQEVDQFVRKNKKNLKILNVSASAGVTKVAEETITRREGNLGVTTVRRGGPANSRNLTQGDVNQVEQGVNDEQSQIVERKTITGKRETITIAQMVPHRVHLGSRPTSLGGSQDVYGTEYRAGATLKVTLIDDVVMSVEGQQYR